MSHWLFDAPAAIESTVKDLVAGSSIRFTERSAHQLNEKLGELRLFAVERGAAG